ncbi:type VII secretion-associated serine protease mycosin [Streptomyces sp. NPDC047028]|uniref:type VII secretion-associated serine protease mycosin n=1 Tax=Streptomyces sp. NPDC047028 TaxID=3155793 RepID=UPI0033F92491
MRNNNLALRLLPAAAGVLGLLLVGVGATPAYADSVQSRQWHLDAMHAAEMWKTSTGRGITVAVIDSGVDDHLADLKGQVLKGRDYSGLSGDEHTDHANHGTGIAALIAATGARGAVNGSYGLAPGAQILPIRMRYATEGYGQVDNKAEFSRVLSQAIRYAADSHAQIINMSLGSSDAPGRHNVETPELESAVKYALSKGKLLFAGVGNNGDTSNLREYPAATPGVVGVGAADENAKVASFSQRGPQVDLVAPGVDMIHACLGGSEICKSKGTSDATAIASASAALIWSNHPGWTNNQVLRVMLNTASKPTGGEKRSDYVGYGGVRPRVALKSPGDPGPADEYPLPDLAASATSAPTPKASTPPQGTGADKTNEEPRAAATETSGSGSGILWTCLGVAAAALLGTAVTVLTVRKRHRRAAFDPVAPPAYRPHPQPLLQAPVPGAAQGGAAGSPSQDDAPHAPEPRS